MHDADTLFWDLDGTLTDPYEGITPVAYTHLTLPTTPDV